MITRATLSSVNQGLPKYRSMLAGNTGYVPTSYASIGSYTATGGETLITISSIPQTYKHLQLRVISRELGGYPTGAGLTVRINGDTGNNYDYHALYTTGGTPSWLAAAATDAWYFGIGSAGGGAEANTFGQSICDITEYSSTSKRKTGIYYDGFVQVSTYSANSVGSVGWNSTAAITSVSISTSNGYAAGTIFAVYGIGGA